MQRSLMILGALCLSSLAIACATDVESSTSNNDLRGPVSMRGAAAADAGSCEAAVADLAAAEVNLTIMIALRVGLNAQPFDLAEFQTLLSTSTVLYQGVEINSSDEPETYSDFVVRGSDGQASLYRRFAMKTTGALRVVSGGTIPSGPGSPLMRCVDAKTAIASCFSAADASPQ
jgi:hypothetical protein